MKQRFIGLMVCIILVAVQANAQKATGAFYGRADVMNTRGMANNYMTELVIKQKGNEVEGIFGYYFKDSYQSFFVRGTYDPKTRIVRINNLPVIYYKSESRNGIECPMNFMGTLLVSKAGSSLNGSFYTEDKYKYTCPELRVTYKIDDSVDLDGSLRHSVAGQKFWQPLEEDYVVSARASEQGLPATVNNPQVQSSPATPSQDTTTNAGKPIASSTTPMNKPVTSIDSSVIIKEKQEKLVKAFEARKNSYMKDIVVESDSLRISFYDNGDIDGDIISLFLNGKPILSSKELSPRALNVYLELDKGKEYNELSMFADNLGKFPPNTALMVITDGVNRYEVYMSSSLSQNAAIRIRRK